MSYDNFMGDSIFAHLLKELDRPDCKTARHIVAKERTIFALRHARNQSPLNIRISEKERQKCIFMTAVKRAAFIACLISLITIVTLSVLDIFRTSSLAAREGSTPLTTTGFENTDYYSVED